MMMMLNDDGNDEGAGSCSVIHWKNFPMQSLQILSSAYNLDGNIRDEDCKQFTSSAFASSPFLVKRTIDLLIFINWNEKYLSIDFDVCDKKVKGIYMVNNLGKIIQFNYFI